MFKNEKDKNEQPPYITIRLRYAGVFCLAMFVWGDYFYVLNYIIHIGFLKSMLHDFVLYLVLLHTLTTIQEDTRVGREEIE